LDHWLYKENGEPQFSLGNKAAKKVGREFLNCMENGNDKFSSEEHFTYLKTRRGSYLLLELLIFVPIF
jgi:hypothetical protein